MACTFDVEVQIQDEPMVLNVLHYTEDVWPTIA
eukprot:CAMPEP_0170653764 /NCGR_PEP_ID=MMETSP0224-20130122/47575_1 /TAXON_ID=285029 /ORGANISM="Togula jolla, Strain CCCM 725" /LENGTH=32 /DNA_ID= /DNA_START= /DNA_END= /DNA_ORIENTATION=